MYTPVNPSFTTSTKVGCEGVYTTRTCYPDEYFIILKRAGFGPQRAIDPHRKISRWPPTHKSKPNPQLTKASEKHVQEQM